MKRLIKKAEVYNGISYRNEYYEVFKNPTYNEWGYVLEYNEGIRGCIAFNGDLYIWPANIMHEDIVNYFNIPQDIHINFNNNQIDYIVTYEYNINELDNIIKSCSSLFNYVTPNCDIVFLRAGNTKLYHAALNNLTNQPAQV